MSYKVTVSALLAGAAFLASSALVSPVEARPLPVTGVEALAGEGLVTTVQARRGRVVRSGRVVPRAPVRYRDNRGAIAAGLAIGAIGAIAAGAAAAHAAPVDDYGYAPAYGYPAYGAYPSGYEDWGYAPAYGYGHAPAYGGGYYGQALPVGAYRGQWRQRQVYRRGVKPEYVNRNPARYGNYRYSAPRRAYRGYGAVYGDPIQSYEASRGYAPGAGWQGGYGPLGNMQSNGMPSAR